MSKTRPTSDNREPIPAAATALRPERAAGACWIFALALALSGFALAACEDDDREDDGTYTLSDVEEHDSEDSCWLVIDDVVYDVTGYLSAHPPGADEILPNCGGDATEAYGAVEHSQTAQSVRDDHRIGTLVEE